MTSFEFMLDYAEVVELVDTLDLGSSAARRGGSSPLFGTILKRRAFQEFQDSNWKARLFVDVQIVCKLTLSISIQKFPCQRLYSHLEV